MAPIDSVGSARLAGYHTKLNAYVMFVALIAASGGLLFGECPAPCCPCSECPTACHSDPQHTCRP